jgi:hypothetical protein
MIPEYQKIEQRLTDQSHSIESLSPAIATLRQQVIIRKRNRTLLRGAAAIASIACLLFVGRWLQHDSSVSHDRHNTAANPSDDVPLRTNNQQPILVIPKPSVTSDSNPPFRAYATWRVPIIVSQKSADGNVSARWEILEIKKNVDPSQLNDALFQSVRNVLPSVPERTNQL